MAPPSDPACSACGLALYQTGVLCPRCFGDPTRPSRPQPRVEGPLASDDRYEVLGTLGNGGMGVVYKVRDLELDEVVALKVLKAELRNREAAVKLFKQELKLARTISHPSVARLHDLLRWRDQLAISQEFIEGHDFDKVLVKGALPLEAILGYLRHICSGLGAAHKLGVVHRDLKPSNIRIDSKDRARLIDFGIAVLVGQQEGPQEDVIGTPHYMSPEQIMGRADVDHRSDLYSLGVLIYQMATGRYPFPRSNMRELVMAHLKEKPQPPSAVKPGLNPLLEGVILRCMEKEPSDRFDSAREVFNHARLAYRPPSLSVPRDVLEQAKSGGGRVLVVDEDATARRRLRSMLEPLGVVVLEADNGRDGIQRVLDEHPDLVMLEVQLPVMDGRDFLRVMKANPTTRELPIVVMTKVDDEEEGWSLRDMGASAFIVKPAQSDVIELLVEKFVH